MRSLSTRRVVATVAAVAGAVALSTVQAVPANAAAAPSTPRVHVLTTTHVVAETKFEYTQEQQTQAWDECDAIERAFAPSAGGARVTEMGSRSVERHEGLHTFITCRLEFLGRPVASVLAADLQRATARFTSWTFTTVPAKVYGAVIVYRLVRDPSHRRESALRQYLFGDAGHIFRFWDLDCNGGNAAGVHFIRIASYNPITSRQVARAVKATSRFSKSRVNTVKVRSPWTAAGSALCRDPDNA